MTDLSHLALAVTDPERSLAFYRDVVGLGGVVLAKPYGFVIQTTNDVSFTLLQGEPPTSMGDFHLGVLLPDGDAVHRARARFRSLGLVEKEWSDEPGYISVKIVDPDGYVVEVAFDEGL